METNFQNFFPKHFAEEKTVSILFAKTRNFCFESISQNLAAKKLLKYGKIML
jgi:hypothetical protein